MEHDISEVFEQGTLFFLGLEVRAMEKPWYSHPAWNGVVLKDLVTAKETGAQPGQTFVTPPRTHHTVGAGSDELSPRVLRTGAGVIK